jgi:hypothetical protein
MEGSPAPRSRRLLSEALIALALAVASVIVYTTTLAPGLLMNDSGEFQTLAATLGHTHPTGYPVYLLLVKPLTFLPVHDIAWRVNLGSGLAAATAVAGVYLLGRVLTGRRWLPVAAAITLALSPTFWSQAIIAEVYAPAAAMMVAVLLSLAVWQRTGKSKWLMAAGLVGGLSLGVHLSVALMAPAAALFVLMESTNRWRNIGIAGCAAMTGCALTLTAFALVDSNRPPGDYFRAVIEPSRSEWGLKAEDLEEFADRLSFSLAAVQYRDNLKRPAAADLRGQLISYGENLPRELSWLWLLMASVGVVQTVRTNHRFALLLMLTLLTHLAYASHHDMGDIHVAYIPSYVILMAFGAASLGATSGSNVSPAGRQRPARAVIAVRPGRAAVEVVLSMVLLAGILFPLMIDDHFLRTGRPKFWVPPGEPPFEVDYSETLKRQLTACVHELEDDALLLTEWALLYPFYYVAHVEQGRTEMRFVQTYPAIGQSRLATTAVDFIRDEIERRPIYVSEPLPEIAEEYHFEPVRRGGMVMYRLTPRH